MHAMYTASAAFIATMHIAAAGFVSGQTKKWVGRPDYSCKRNVYSCYCNGAQLQLFLCPGKLKSGLGDLTILVHAMYTAVVAILQIAAAVFLFWETRLFLCT